MDLDPKAVLLRSLDFGINPSRTLIGFEANFLSDHDLQIFDPSMANIAVSARPLGPLGLKVAKPEIPVK